MDIAPENAGISTVLSKSWIMSWRSIQTSLTIISARSMAGAASTVAIRVELMKIGGAGTISENPGRPSNLHDVYIALQALSKRRGISSELTTYQGKLAVVEGFAHELAHQLEAGLNFASRILAADDKEADAHEAATLRIEVAGLSLLGVRVSLRHLWRDANWRANWRAKRPALTRRDCLLSSREQRCAAAFSRIVRGFMVDGPSRRGV